MKTTHGFFMLTLGFIGCSTSSPGVRIVTATGVGAAPAARAARRISSGSSTESSSEDGVESDPVTRPTSTLAT